jgi:hypothetical protein
MGTIEFITKEDLEQFKQELFAELRRPTFKPPIDKNRQRPFIKSYEVIKLLGISPGTLQHLRKSGQMDSPLGLLSILWKYFIGAFG